MLWGLFLEVRTSDDYKESRTMMEEFTRCPIRDLRLKFVDTASETEARRPCGTCGFCSTRPNWPQAQMFDALRDLEIPQRTRDFMAAFWDKSPGLLKLSCEFEKATAERIRKLHTDPKFHRLRFSPVIELNAAFGLDARLEQLDTSTDLYIWEEPEGRKLTWWKGNTEPPMTGLRQLSLLDCPYFPKKLVEPSSSDLLLEQ